MHSRLLLLLSSSSSYSLTFVSVERYSLSDEAHNSKHIYFEMTSMPRSFRHFTEEQLKAEKNYEYLKRTGWMIAVNDQLREFYGDTRVPRLYDLLRMTSTLKLDEEQYRCTFNVQLWEVRNSYSGGLVDWIRNRSAVNWVRPGQVEVTYIVDGVEWRKKTLDLRIEVQDNAEPAATFIDDIGEELKWDNFLLIFLKFDAGSIRYHNPDSALSSANRPLVLREVMKHHHEIYNSPQASRGREFTDFGYTPYEYESLENQGPSSS